ncbi:MAG: MFS transporter, partial [Pyrinomonadaceae bacterium]|nr:MFS transporter [Phycisphaerales bacterium]
RTGRRDEGVFFAGAFFVQKCCSGLGILASGIIVDLVGFPSGATPGTGSNVRTSDPSMVVFPRTSSTPAMTVPWRLTFCGAGAPVPVYASVGLLKVPMSTEYCGAIIEDF